LGIFEIGSCELFCPGWLWILKLFSASWVATITGLSHWCPGSLGVLGRAVTSSRVEPHCLGSEDREDTHIRLHWANVKSFLHGVVFWGFVCVCVCVCVCVWYWGLNSGPSPWSTPPDPFLWRVFKIGSHKLFTRAGFEPWSSWVARIIGVSHQHLALHGTSLNRRCICTGGPSNHCDTAVYHLQTCFPLWKLGINGLENPRCTTYWLQHTFCVRKIKTGIQHS
jgi:hypothetical protein